MNTIKNKSIKILHILGAAGYSGTESNIGNEVYKIVAIRREEASIGPD